MIKKASFEINNIPIYEDIYMEDNKIITGRKGGSEANFIVANIKTIEIMWYAIVLKQRQKKIKRILNV